MSVLINLLVLLVFTALPIHGLVLRTESDVDKALLNNAVTNETYLFLKERIERPLDPCRELNDFREIPGITESDMDALKTACLEGPVLRESLSPDLLEKIALFTDFGTNSTRPLSIKYSFKRDLADTQAALSKDHLLSVRFQAGPVTAITQAKSDAFGNGSFKRNALVLKSPQNRAIVTLGSFRPIVGQGVLLGGNVRTQSLFLQKDGFQETLLHPESSDPFGAMVVLSDRFWRGTGFYSNTASRLFPGNSNRIVGGDFEAGPRELRTGVAFIQTRIGLNNRADEIISNGVSIHEKYRTRTTRLESEAAYDGKNAGFSLEALRHLGSATIALSTWGYSDGFVSPAGRGPGHFTSSESRIIAAEDSVSLYGLRKGEEGVRFFGEFNLPMVRFRPAMTVAASTRLQERSYQFELLQDWAFSPLDTRILGTNRLELLRDTLSATTVHSMELETESTLRKFTLWRNNFRGTFQDSHSWRYFFETGVAQEFLVNLKIEGAFFFSRARLITKITQTKGISLDETMTLRNREYIRLHALLEFDQDFGYLRPETFGLECGLYF